MKKRKKEKKGKKTEEKTVKKSGGRRRGGILGLVEQNRSLMLGREEANRRGHEDGVPAEEETRNRETDSEVVSNPKAEKRNRKNG